MLLVSERSLWYDGTRHVRPIRNFRIGTSLSISNRDVRFEFESNLEASQVPNFDVIVGQAYAWPTVFLCLAVLCFYSKTGFWSSYCQISTDLDNILHTPIVVRNTCGAT